MSANGIVDPDWNLPAIVAAAGGEMARAHAWRDAAGDCRLAVEGVAPEALAAAIAGYDHAAERLLRARQEAMAALAESDGPAARLTEDLIAALIARGSLAVDDLPPAARARLEARRALRVALSR